MAISAPLEFSDPFKVASGKCLCGCGNPARKRFAMGHDGRLRGRLVRIARDASHAHRDDAEETLRRLDWLHFLTPPKLDVPQSPMVETRAATLKACREALMLKCPGAREIVKDELFQVGSATVRPKGTGTADGEWIWDVGDAGSVQDRETFYILYDVNDPDNFFIVPTDFVRGALEGAHHRWHQDGDQLNDEGELVNPRTLNSTTRRVGKWPVRRYKNAWHLLTSRMNS